MILRANKKEHQPKLVSAPIGREAKADLRFFFEGVCPYSDKKKRKRQKANRISCSLFFIVFSLKTIL